MSQSTAVRPRILIVDDEPRNHLVYRKVLASLDIHIEEAHSGQQALMVAHQQDFFLILMDVQMPGMDGFEAASLILEHPKTQHIPVIFVTALAKDEVFQCKGYESGAVDYLTKPINEDILKSKISIFLLLWRKRQLLEAKNEELKQLNNELEKTACALAKAKIESELAAKAKSDFLSTMSHEIRTPMNAVLGTVQLLKKTPMSDHQTKLVENISYGGQTLMVIIDDILNLSKIEAGKIELESISFDLGGLLERAIDAFIPSANDKNIQLVLERGQPGEDSVADSTLLPVYVKGDPTRITQVVNNLISNAIKFTNEGAVTVILDKVIADADTISFNIVVRDSGIGMTEAQQNHLFSAFSQADSSTTRLYGGTGLGLSICKGLVDAMEGEILVESAVNKGSQFTVALKMLVAQESDVLPPAPDNIPREAQKTANILVVDDVETNICIVQFLLEEEGHTVLTAMSGQDAIDLFDERRDTLDLILMDVQMPEMDGFEAVRRIRALEEVSPEAGKAIPIVALTADVLKNTRDKCFESGMNGFLNKPIEEAQLFNVIQQHLRI